LSSPDAPSLIEFPSAFPIKVMGLNEVGFVDAIVAIVREFDPAFDPGTVTLRPSRADKYLGLTLTVAATSREQLDAMYRALSSHAMVRMVL
jgi:putative lipoic acid-binding regulatory protein